MKKVSVIYKLILYTIIVIALFSEIYDDGSLRLEAFIYFTIQSNLLVALYLFLDLTLPERSREKCILRGISLLAIIMTGIIYNFVLYKIYLDWGTTGYSFSRTVTHVVSPLGFIIDWILFDKHGNMKWKDIFIWLVYPLAYCLLSVLAVIFIGFSIYTFFETSGGYIVLLKWLGKLFCLVVIISIFIVGFDKALLPKRRKNFNS